MALFYKDYFPGEESTCGRQAGDNVVRFVVRAWGCVHLSPVCRPPGADATADVLDPCYPVKGLEMHLKVTTFMDGQRAQMIHAEHLTFNEGWISSRCSRSLPSRQETRIALITNYFLISVRRVF
jgi:hypothetical protein